ncbi:MAG: TraR/DksA C4-type zinc finger protein [Deltaproteobacteria bacterium]|nr:MAG: TraR/DksA C4-type zinc finger protein [Deltaproteobacteria bacterium]
MLSLSEESKQRFREILLDMRQELFDQVKAQVLSIGNRDSVGDLADCASADMVADYAWMLRGRLRERLLLIEDALDATESDEYGFCEKCYEPINEKRLLIMPVTRFCVRCQSEIKRKSRVPGQIAA